jgi:uncharacterized membrane protein
VLRGLLAGAVSGGARTRAHRAVMAWSGSGLLLLWATGFMLTFTKWGGFGALPWQFHAKLGFVVLLTLAVGASHAFQAKARRGDTAAAAMLPRIGVVSLVSSILVVVFAVLTFD